MWTAGLCFSLSMSFVLQAHRWPAQTCGPTTLRPQSVSRIFEKAGVKSQDELRYRHKLNGYRRCSTVAHGQARQAEMGVIQPRYFVQLARTDI